MAVTKTRSSYPSTAGHDIQVSYAVWKDDKKKPIGVIQVTHGWGEYGERYEELCTFLAENGYVVAAQDHLGHGRTAGVKRIGLYPPKAAKYMIEDMHELYNIMHKQYKKLPYMIYGHSLGSFMVRWYLTKYGKELDAAVICGTGWLPGVAAYASPVITALTSLVSKPYEKDGAKMDQKNAERTEEMGDRDVTKAEGLINSWLSYDKQNIRNYVNDPLIGLAMSPTVFFMLPCTLNAGKPGWIRKVPKDLPCFIISGKQDLVGMGNGFGPTRVYKQMKNKKRNVKLKLYDHAKHEIHNEGTIKDEVFHDILDFFNANNPKCK